MTTCFYFAQLIKVDTNRSSGNGSELICSSLNAGMPTRDRISPRGLRRTWPTTMRPLPVVPSMASSKPYPYCLIILTNERTCSRRLLPDRVYLCRLANKLGAGGLPKSVFASRLSPFAPARPQLQTHHFRRLGECYITCYTLRSRPD